MTMLKGISNVLSHELLKILMEMGHGDTILLADANFPAASHTTKLVRADGHAIPSLLEAILELFPVDQYIEEPVTIMERVLGDHAPITIWGTYEEILSRFEGKLIPLRRVERFAFYEEAKSCYAIVATGETAQYANIILTKGVIKPQ